MDNEPIPYVCDFCSREVDEAEVYVEDAVYCPDCWMDRHPEG